MIMTSTEQNNLAADVIDDIYFHAQEYITDLIHWSLDGRNLEKDDYINIDSLENKIYKELLLQLKNNM